MAQITELSANGLSGRVHIFVAKTAFVIVVCFTQNITFDAVDKELTFDAVDKELTFDAVDKELTFNLICL